MANNVFSRTLGTPIPQSEQEDPRQVANNAGGFTFEVTDKTRLERFLILGTEGGTYYVDEQKLTKDNINFLRELIERDEQLVRDTVVEISQSGRAFRNSPAIFCLAALFTFGKAKSSQDLAKVCRTSTHLFEFAEYIKLLGGWGRAKRRAIADWYISKDVDSLAYQVVKYRQRNGWTHKGLLMLSHPVGLNKAIGDFVHGFDNEVNVDPLIIAGFKRMQASTMIGHVLSALERYPNLPWEAIPTQFLKVPDVWKMLFGNGQLNGQALVRNITRLARIGAFEDMHFARAYADKLVDEEMIQRTRLHPFQYLLASTVHQRGQRDRKYAWSHTYEKNWATNPVIVNALDDGFYRAFKYVEPANKRTMIALDVSGSMSQSMAGIDLTAAEVCAAMSMTIARTEPFYQIMGFSQNFVDLGIAPNMSLAEVMQRTKDRNFGSTDCSLPMVYAKERGIDVDTFVVMTDSETWAGNVHPHVALKDYRRFIGHDAKLIVVACTPTRFSIANPTDSGMLDVAGADSNLPKLVSAFSAGRI